MSSQLGEYCSCCQGQRHSRDIWRGKQKTDVALGAKKGRTSEEIHEPEGNGYVANNERSSVHDHGKIYPRDETSSRARVIVACTQNLYTLEYVGLWLS